MTLVESGDRGVTLNKALAWSILVVLASLIFYAGSTVSGLTQSVETQNELIRDAAVSRGQLEVRVRVLENAAASTLAEFRSINSTLEEMKLAQRETNALLRQLTQPRP